MLYVRISYWLLEVSAFCGQRFSLLSNCGRRSCQENRRTCISVVSVFMRLLRAPVNLHGCYYCGKRISWKEPFGKRALRTWGTHASADGRQAVFDNCVDMLCCLGKCKRCQNKHLGPRLWATSTTTQVGCVFEHWTWLTLHIVDNKVFLVTTLMNIKPVQTLHCGERAFCKTNSWRGEQTQRNNKKLLVVTLKIDTNIPNVISGIFISIFNLYDTIGSWP